MGWISLYPARAARLVDIFVVPKPPEYPHVFKKSALSGYLSRSHADVLETPPTGYVASDGGKSEGKVKLSYI
jgi:hypothetical protein